MTVIIRAEESRNYTAIDNRVLNDDRLSLTARGLFAYLCAQPDGQQVYDDHFFYNFPDGGQAMCAALLELEECGYVIFVQKGALECEPVQRIVCHRRLQPKEYGRR